MCRIQCCHDTLIGHIPLPKRVVISGESIKLFTCDLISFNNKMSFFSFLNGVSLEKTRFALISFHFVRRQLKAKTRKNVNFARVIYSLHSSSGAIQHGRRSQSMIYFRLQFLLQCNIQYKHISMLVRRNISNS